MYREIILKESKNNSKEYLNINRQRASQFQKNKNCDK